MTTIANSLVTPFTPAIGTFVVQATGGVARLDRRQTAGAAWTVAGTLDASVSQNVDNPVAGVQYQFVAVGNSTPLVQADQ